MSNFKVGDRVKVIANGGGLFYNANAYETGTVDNITNDGDHVWVRFDHDSELDYGNPCDLLLVSRPSEQTAPAVSVPADESIAAKLRLLETTIEEIKLALGLRSAV